MFGIYPRVGSPEHGKPVDSWATLSKGPRLPSASIARGSLSSKVRSRSGGRAGCPRSVALRLLEETGRVLNSFGYPAIEVLSLIEVGAFELITNDSMLGLPVDFLATRRRNRSRLTLLRLNPQASTVASKLAQINGWGSVTVYELREPDELQRFYNYVVANPNVCQSLAGARFELTSGRGVIVEVVPAVGGSGNPTILARFDRSPKSVLPSKLAFPFLLEKGWLKSFTIPHDLIEPFRTLSTEKQAASSTPQVDTVSPPAPQRKKNWHAFCEVMRRHHIKDLYHFTDSRNLASIIEHGGLFSWQQCKKRGIKVAAPGGDGDSRSRDRRKGLGDYVRLSFRADHPMRHAAERDGRIQNVEFLRIDPSIIYLRSTLFCVMNANSTEARVRGDLETFEQIKFDLATGSRRWYTELEKNFSQAEVLVKGHVPLDLIEIL